MSCKLLHNSLLLVGVSSRKEKEALGSTLPLDPGRGNSMGKGRKEKRKASQCNEHWESNDQGRVA